jgi:hypothetical protein
VNGLNDARYPSVWRKANILADDAKRFEISAARANSAKSDVKVRQARTQNFWRCPSRSWVASRR